MATDYGSVADDLWKTPAPAAAAKTPASSKATGTSSSKSSSSGGGGGGSSGGSSGGGGGGGSSAQASRLDAKAILAAGMQSVLGRNPRATEVDKYLKALRAQEASGPLGADATAQFTTDWMDDNMHKHVGTQMAAQTYMDVFVNSLKAPGGV